MGCVIEDVGQDFGDVVVREGVEDVAPLARARDQLRGCEDLEPLGHGGKRGSRLGGQLGDTVAVIEQQLQQPKATLISEGGAESGGSLYDLGRAGVVVMRHMVGARWVRGGQIGLQYFHDSKSIGMFRKAQRDAVMRFDSWTSGKRPPRPVPGLGLSVDAQCVVPVMRG